MSAPSPSITSLIAHVAGFDAGAHVAGLAWVGDAALFALAEGDVLVRLDGDSRVFPVHPGAGILVCAATADAILTGGDDGRVVATAPDGTQIVIGDEKGRWVDALTVSASGAVAWSTGKRVTARDDKGRVRTREAPTTAQGLAFAPKGYRLAISHYNGVSVWFPNTEAEPERLEWKGSHLDVLWSPDARFVITSMQENSLHGWRLPEKADMRMSGYPAKTRSFSWSHDGLWLATSGADAAIVWPFQDKQGPMGKAPRECGVRPSRVSKVAFHPGAMVLAIGYDDGFVLLCRLADGSELLVRKAEPDGGAVTALAWDRKGRRLAFGCASGAAGILTLPA